MGLSTHAASLAAKHAQLESQINHESQRPLPNWKTIAELKKEKLKLKEAIRRFDS